jgi:hypothetical protein
MSISEQAELSALVYWMKTFPQLETFNQNKENNNDVDLLEDPNVAR